MPLLRLETSAALPEDKRKALLASLSKAVAETIGKPEQYVMVTASQAAMLMSGKPGDGAFVDLRSIGGLSDEGNRKLSQQVCKLLKDWQYATDTDPLSVAAPLPTRAVRLRNGDTLISDQFNNRVIRVNHAGVIVASYGLPLAGGPVDPFPFGNNVGYDLRTTQKGLYSPYDAKVVGDYTGLTPPFDFDGDADD